ncbi:helix-turn-helix domain-containing protein [Ornithinimicrobium cerasi]|uniref:DNA-binding protein n=1 Tax=Ornithinimicrobium cerasi TaxID=2248773 RepID=A0A285VDT5_9MICO|nr:helix-turn-helix transcriptional regulator [Ornithinimicrobium cerasi]SOC52153.1 hypothetical protein SAMN05421879_101431 [Ornithinimicrobium cerasi]
MSDVARNVAEQIDLYGEPLADLFARLTSELGLSQAGLARTVGMSPPMLSQLGSGHRIKIGNPSVLRRLEALLQLHDEVTAGRVATDDLETLLAQVRDSTQPWTTTRHDLRPAADAPGTDDADPDLAGAETVRSLLRAVASGSDLRDAAERLAPHHPALADLLRTYGLGSVEDSVEHLRNHRELF